MARSDYNRPFNPVDVLRYNPLDPLGWHRDATRRSGEFALYDEYDPLRKITLNDDGTANKTDLGGKVWFLNFATHEGTYVPAGTIPGATGQQATTYVEAWNDGNDRIFGDTGNDWLVGGTGRDNMYGGFGNDLMNADDKQETNLLRNDQPDTQPSYEDRAFGGAGRDVLIANTGGDRLIDWVGEFNSYLVPFAPFGMATVSRTLQPQLAEFLYTLGASDGADPTRFKDTNGDPALAYRNGEPQGELGVVRQKDFAWQSQTGAPADPQAGNIPGGPRDVLRTANFNDGTLQALAPDSGTWTVNGGSLQVASSSNQADAVAVYQVGDALPSYFEVLGTIKVVKPTAGWDANSYMIFDYQDANNFKFAGLNVSTNKLEMGIRTAAGWQVLKQASFPGSLRDGTWYNVMLSVNGLTATLTVDNTNAFSHTFQATVLDGWSYGLNWGLVGFGSNKSRGEIDNIAVQVVPQTSTVLSTDDFTSGTGPMVNTSADGRTGTWTAAAGRLTGTPLVGSDRATQLMNLNGVTQMTSATLLELSATFKTAGLSGIVFDCYNDKDFKFAAIDMPNKQIVIGHVKGGNVSIDAWVARSTLLPTVDYKLGVSIKGSTVSVTVNDQAAVGFVFNSVASDGRFGLFSQGASASFDTVTVKTNDRSVPAQLQGLQATTAVAVQAISVDAAAPLLQEAQRRWALVEDELHLAAINRVRLAVADLPGDQLAQVQGDILTLDVDAAGHGWFIDATPGDNREFAGRGARLDALPQGDAAGRVDLLSVLAHELGHVIGLGHSDEGVMAAQLQPGQRATPDIWGRSKASADTSEAVRGQAQATAMTAMTAGPAFAVDWNARAAAAPPAAGPGAGPQPVRPWAPAPAAAPAWQQRFVNDLGASAERLQPNSGLRLHLPVARELSSKLSRL